MNFEIFENYFLFLKNHPFLFFQIISGFIPLIICFFYFAPVWAKYRLLLLFSICIFCFELTENIYAALSIKNHFIYLIYYLIETIVLTLFFVREIKDKLYNRIVYFVIPFVIIFFIINLFSSNKLMDNYSNSIQSIVFIILSLINFYYILFKKNIPSLSSSIFFWISIGAFLYFSGKFFVSLYIYQFAEKYNNLENYWAIVSFSMVIFRVFLAVGISKTKYNLA